MTLEAKILEAWISSIKDKLAKPCTQVELDSFGNSVASMRRQASAETAPKVEALAKAIAEVVPVEPPPLWPRDKTPPEKP